MAIMSVIRILEIIIITISIIFSIKSQWATSIAILVVRISASIVIWVVRHSEGIFPKESSESPIKVVLVTANTLHAVADRRVAWRAQRMMIPTEDSRIEAEWRVNALLCWWGSKEGG